MMRTLLIAALALSSTVTLLPSPDAEACGNYRREPQVLRLTRYTIPGEEPGARGTQRSFVWTGLPAPDGLAPGSFDPTDIADGSALAEPMAFTLLGPTGSRVVTSVRQVFVSGTRRHLNPTSAFEVPIAAGADFVIAIEGAQADARWLPLEARRVTAQTRRWLEGLGVPRYHQGAVVVRRLRGTDFETVSLYPAGGSQLVTYVKRGDRNLGRIEGRPLGGVAHDGARRLVFEQAGGVTTFRLGADR